MKKIKTAIVLLLLLFLCGCKEYGEKRIVKLVIIDNENVSLYCYDYSSDKIDYVIEKSPNTGIENTLSQMLSENEYNLKLCKYVVCSDEIIKNFLPEVVDSIINLKFSTDVSIINGNTTENSINYIELNDSRYPVYSYDIAENGINGIVENIDEKTKYIISEDEYIKTLPSNQSVAADIITNMINEGIYVFEFSGKTFSAYLENISTFYTADSDTLNLNITAVLKSYKGLPSNKTDKEYMIKLIKDNLNKDIYNLYADEKVVKTLKLDWVDKIYSTDSIQINISVI